MLKLIFGRSGFGKTEYVFGNIQKLAESGNQNILLITPEQYSLIAERRLLKALKEDKINYVDNSSFSRISNDVKRLYGGDNLPVLSKGGKVIMMMQAIDSVKDELSLFNKKIDSLSFVSSMINVYDEMKSCNLSSTEIFEMTQRIENKVLLNKLTDISLVMHSYEDLIKDKYLDSSDALTRLYNKLADKDYFSNKTVFIDGFNGFVAQEYKLLELIIAQAKNVYITLCADYENEELFSYVNKSAKIIEKIACKANIETEILHLQKNLRSANETTKAIEKYLYYNDKQSVDVDTTDALSLYSSKNITDECSYVSIQIKKLLRTGYKASEIAVITRDMNKYRAELSTAFKKYCVPFFYDERQPINTQPVVILIKYLLRCVNNSLRSDDIISLAKTGLTKLTDAQINALENYVYLWNINGVKWSKKFENSTRGFVNEISDSDKKALEEVNKSRKYLIEPILKFRQTAKSNNCKEICKGIYNTLIAYTADKKIKENAQSLSDSGFFSLASEQGRIWDLVMNILNQLAVTVQKDIKLKDFDHLFSLIISTEDLGSLPSGIDNVQFGQADRIRTDNVRAVFLLGVNNGEFPLAVSGGGLLTENERRIMLDNDFKLYSYGEIFDVQEKYFAYMACACAKEKVFISYTGSSSKDFEASETITEIKSVFTNVNEITYSDINKIDLIETNETAFELMSKNYFNEDKFYSSLKEYFSNDDRFKIIKSIAENETEVISDKKTAVSLFDYNMYVSASRVEDYYNCPFRYFCKFGLSAKPRKKAEIDPMERGTLIHFILEMILSRVGSKALSKMDEAEIKTLVDEYIKIYFETKMGNVTDASKRFLYNYKRISKMVYGVVIHLAKEFSQCDFEASAFELSIDKDGEVKPEVIFLDDGGTIQIRGSIDRVDTYKKGNDTFVRVVDYKSGDKAFSLSDILDGLNLQMFIYLFSLCEDKNAKLNGIPAGVLYMHAARSVFTFSSKEEAQRSVDSSEESSFKMKGLVLADDEGDIPKAMENSLKGRFIPVKANAKGTLVGQMASLEELGYMHKKINSLIEEMGNELHEGNIARLPIKNKNHKHTCDYCDYADLCANKKSILPKETEDVPDDFAKELLRKEFENNA